MITRKQPAKRLFRMIGLPPEPGEATVAPAPAPTPAPQPAPMVPTTSDPKPRGGLSGLASQEYRAPRDATTGKVIEASADVSAGSAEAQARALFGIAPPISSRPKTPLVSNKFPSMRQTLMLEAEDLIALFDESPATKVGEREVFAEMDFLVPPDMLRHRIARLKKLIAASKEIIEGLSVHIMKLRRGKEDVLDKTTREMYKREENARLARCNAKLSRYRAALRDGNCTEKAWRYRTQAAYFRDVVDDCMTFTDYGETYYAQGEFKTPAEGAGYYTTDLVRDIIATRIFDVSRYEVMMGLDNSALHLMGVSDAEQKRTWANVQRWENCVIKAAVFHGVLRPRKDLMELLALTPFVKQALSADDDPIEADETENALALKTGGACYGGGIKGGGVRFNQNKGTFRRRSLESFDKHGPRKDGDVNGSGEDSGFTSLRDINDDAESYQP
jgi:hypothetical protein